MLYAALAACVLVLLIVVLFNLKVTLKAHFDSVEGVFHCSVHYLWIDYIIAPAQAKKKKKKKPKVAKKEEAPKEQEDTLRNLFKEKGLRGFLEMLQTAVKSLWTLLKSILRRTVLEKLDFRLNIVGEDAANTAILYGWANSIVYPIVGAVLETVSDCKEHNIQLTPDYTEGADSAVQIDIVLSVKPSKLLAMLFEDGKEIKDLLSALNDLQNNSKENKK